MSDNGSMCLGLHLGISYGRCGLSFVYVFYNNTQKTVSFEVGVLLRFFQASSSEVTLLLFSLVLLLELRDLQSAAKKSLLKVDD